MSKLLGAVRTANPVSEDFNMKVVTYLLATPDEIANVLMDPDKRAQWDPDLVSATANGTNSYRATYRTNNYTETLTYSAVLDSLLGTLFIKE